MTSPQHAISRHFEARDTPTRPFTEDAFQRPDNDTMDKNPAAVIAYAANSEYGSDVSLAALSDYGSDIDLDDLQEDTALGNILAHLAASAPNHIASPAIEGYAHNDAVATHARGQPLVHREERAIQSSPVVAYGVSMELEYDAPSRQAFSGTSQFSMSTSRCKCQLTG